MTQQAPGVGREHERTVAPVRLPVVRRVAGRNDQIAVGRIDSGAVPRPDRRVTLVTAARDDQGVPVAAERVPDVDDLPGLLGHRHDVALVRRRVADVAAGRHDHEAARDVDRRGHLLVGRVERDRRRPQHLAVGDAELPHQTIGADA